MRRKNKARQWLLFTRGVLDKLVSFIIAGRTTYTAATRHISADVQAFPLRRQDVVKLGTAIMKTFEIPPQSGQCPLCGPNPAFIVIDAQALGCSDPDDTSPLRPGENCPVLDIPASKLCIIEKATLRDAISRVLRSSTALNASQVAALRAWQSSVDSPGRPTPEAAAAKVFFHFFPLGNPQRAPPPPLPPADEEDAAADSAVPAGTPAAPAPTRRRSSMGATLESAVRVDMDGKLVLGGKGPAPKKPVEMWYDRVGLCQPAFDVYPREDEDVWCAVRPFLHAMLTETICGMFQSFDEKAVALLANAIRIRARLAWRKFTAAADGVGYVASFLGRFADELDEDRSLRTAVGELLLQAVSIEKIVDEAYDVQASKKSTLDAGWHNAQYCSRWKRTPTPADYLRWRMEQTDLSVMDENDPLVSYEYFAGLPRVRPGIFDSEAAKRRVQYRGKDRHAADLEGEGDACNKAFSIKAGLTQGVFNVVCPHVITLGFRCLFRAESVGEALSIVLERFPKLPDVIFYDVACKLDKNAMRRVRPIMRAHGVRCILDRSHSITHSCSPIYMPDDSLGSTAGVATQAAEVSHSIAVVNRTSLAYMAPATYMVHKMVQVAFMNLRKLYRLHDDNSSGENDHVSLAPFFHAKVSHQCSRVSVCACKQSGVAAISVEEEHQAAAEVSAAGLANSTGQANTVGEVNASGQANMEGQVDAMGVVKSVSRAPATTGAATASGRIHATGRANAALTAAAAVAALPGVAGAHSQEDPGDETEQAAVEVCAAGLADLGRSDFIDLSNAVDDNASVAVTDDKALDQFEYGWLLEEYELSATLRSVPAPNPMDTQPLSKAVARLARSLVKQPAAQAVRPRNKARIILTGADFLRLAGESWLNDELLNSYVALINHRDGLFRTPEQGGEPTSSAARPAVPRTRMFNTFFFSLLAPSPSHYSYDRVRNWGVKLGLDLNDVDRIIVPVNIGQLHWVLVVADVGKRMFYFYDSMTPADRNGVVDTLRRWLSDEVRCRLGADMVGRWDMETWAVRADPSWPRQTDAGSCGVFALMAAECFSLGAPLLFCQQDMPTLRERTAIALFFDEVGVDADVLSLPDSDTPPASDSEGDVVEE